MAGETRKRREGSRSKKQGTILDQLRQESCSTLEVNKPPNTDLSCVTHSTDHGRPVSTLETATSALSSEDLRKNNGSKEKSKKRAIEHDEADTRVIEATSSPTSPGLQLLSDTAERHSQATASATTGQSNDCVSTVAQTSPMPDLFGQDDDGDTFLHIAVVQGDQPLTEFFIQRMKSRGVDIYNKLRQTPLHLAVITHQIYIVKRLIEGGADVNLMDRHGQTALHLACQQGDVNCVYAIRDGTQTNRVEIRIDLKNFQGCSALHVATLKGSQQLIGTLLDMGADINDQTLNVEEQHTSGTLRIRFETEIKGNSEKAYFANVKKCFYSSANIRTECKEDSNSGRTPLHHAVEAGKYNVAEYLISRGADVNKVTFAGNTPLHTASGREMDQMVKLLLNHGANVNIANLEGDIPKVVRSSEQAKRQFRSKEKDSKRRKR